MDLALFPMDSQLCTLVIESYGYTMADLVYVWNDKLKSVEVHILVFYGALQLFYCRSVLRCPWLSFMWLGIVSAECWKCWHLATIPGCVLTFSSAGPWDTTSYRYNMRGYVHTFLQDVIKFSWMCFNMLTPFPCLGVHPLQPDRGDVLGQLLSWQGLSTSQGGAWGDYCAHHGHPHGGRQQVCLNDLD